MTHVHRVRLGLVADMQALCLYCCNHNHTYLHQAIIEETFKWCMQRRAFGKRLIDQGVVRSLSRSLSLSSFFFLLVLPIPDDNANHTCNTPPLPPFPLKVRLKLAQMIAQFEPTVHGARFSAEIYTRGCHWIPRLLA